MRAREKIVYVTANKFKIDENNVLLDCTLEDGKRIGDLFEFQIRHETITETLEVNLELMVRAEARSAYAQTKVPCIVEHAGLIFDGHPQYPRGLTKPMWNALGDKFVLETQMADRRAKARAVVGYCDGMSIHVFVGETDGMLINPPRGARDFYWDRIFVPNDPSGKAAGKTYAEIVEESSLGLFYKMQHLSQSGRAMRKFLEFRRRHSPELWQ